MNPITPDTDTKMNSMSTSTRTYIGAVIAAGAVVLVTFAPREIANPMLALTFLAAMLVASLFKLRIPLGDGHSTLSMAAVVDFAVLMTSGVELAVVIAASGALVQCSINVRRRQPWYRTAFSVAAVVLTVGSAGLIWQGLGGAGASGVALVLPLAAASVAYFAINSGLVAAAIALSNGSPVFGYWQAHFLRMAPSCFLAAGLVGGITLAMAPDAYLLLLAAAVPTAVFHFAHAEWFSRVAARMTIQSNIPAHI